MKKKIPLENLKIYIHIFNVLRNVNKNDKKSRKTTIPE